MYMLIGLVLFILGFFESSFWLLLIVLLVYLFLTRTRRRDKAVGSTILILLEEIIKRNTTDGKTLALRKNFNHIYWESFQSFAKDYGAKVWAGDTLLMQDSYSFYLLEYSEYFVLHIYFNKSVFDNSVDVTVYVNPVKKFSAMQLIDMFKITYDAKVVKSEGKFLKNLAEEIL